MATGFVSRWKGKVTAASFWMGGFCYSAVEAATIGAQAASTLGNNAISNVISSSGAGIYNVPPPIAGLERTLAVTSISSGVFFKAASGTSFGIIGTSTMNVLKSTTVMTITLMGLSSVLWQVKSVWSTSTTVIPQPTYSTTT